MPQERLDVEEYARELGSRARAAAVKLAVMTGDRKNAALAAAADAIRAATGRIVAENAKDLAAGREAGLSTAMLDRLTLDPGRVDKIAAGVAEVARLKDPVGEVISGWRRPNGLEISKVRVPLGVILMIYEARPNVTADAAALCLKSGNACILRGGKEAVHSSLAIAAAICPALDAAGIPGDAVQVAKTTDRALVGQLITMPRYIDLVIARGGKELIKRVVDESRVPVMKHYEGICHTFVDETADVQMASDVCFNAKAQRPGVCNAMETLLVHEGIAREFLPAMAARYAEAGVELRGDEAARRIVPSMKEAAEEDWRTEYLDLILSIKVVKDVGEAVEHIRKYGSAHSDAIVTRSLPSAERFVREVDSSAVFVNASTRFNDGGEFGFGAEIGISTDKLHARGPMGLEELTSYKYVVYGSGQVRK